jgi:hypothetical protein
MVRSRATDPTAAEERAWGIAVDCDDTMYLLLL